MVTCNLITTPLFTFGGGGGGGGEWGVIKKQQPKEVNWFQVEAIVEGTTSIRKSGILP